MHSWIHPERVLKSPVGVIPKKNKLANRWMIVDLSTPESYSVNDGILWEASSLSYTLINDLSYN